MAFVIFNIGSNMGSRRLFLSRAVRMLAERFGDFELSHVVESDPVGFDSTRSFLNLCMAVNTELPPEEILDIAKEIETEISSVPHRTPDGGYADREIDIDIIAIDSLEISTPTLTIPHPRMAERRFVLEPLQEIAPGWVHPVLKLTPLEMLAALPDEREE